MMKHKGRLRAIVAPVVVAVAVILLWAGSAAATIDGAGWQFKDLSSHKVPITFEPAFDSARIAWTTHDTEQSDVHLLDIATGVETQVTDTPAVESNVALDGNRLAWVSRATWDPTTPAEMWLRNLDTGATLHFAAGRVADQPGLQLVSDHLAWAQYDPAPAGQTGSQLALYVYTISAGTTTRVTDRLATGGGGYGGQTTFDLGETHIAFVEGASSGGDAEAWLYNLADLTRVKLGSSAAVSRHVSLEGDLVTWAAPAESPGAAYQFSDIFLRRISAGTTEKIATIPRTSETFPKTDGRFVVWDTYLGSASYTENLRMIQAYDSQSGQSIDVSHNLFLNFTPEVSDGLVVWSRGGELDSEIMAHDLVSGQTTQLSATRTWMDQAAQVHGRTVVWWTVWFSMEPGPDLPDGFVVATAPDAFTDPFKDVAGTHRYRTAILGVTEQGIAGGYAAGAEREFRPEAPLLRAQFAKMICEAFDVPVTEDMGYPFTDLGPDVPDNLYPHEYVAALSATGILKGKTSSIFDPYSPVTRAQAVSILVRALDKFHPGLLANIEGQAPGAFHWDPPHVVNLKKAYANDLLSSLVDWVRRWDAGVSCNRGEAAQLVWNALSLIDQP
jgi:hypothetical protein